ncbi:MAG: hypothetical protein K8I02_13200 [Candidatus Methylomirabilis sp.]|nr:hypothetical protein [Deltaproteobacteria bacterium]
MRLLARFFVLIVIVLALFFSIQNAQAITQEIELTFKLFGQAQWSRAFALYELVTLALLVGLWLGGAFDILLRGRLKAQLRGKNRAIRDLEKELRTLRNLPIVEAEEGRGAAEGEGGLPIEKGAASAPRAR